MQQPPGQPRMQYGLPMNNAPLPVILNTEPQSKVKDKYKVKSVKVLSIIQIVLGSSAIVFLIWDIIHIHKDTSDGIAGIWKSVLFIIAGGLGVFSTYTKTTCTITSFLVMSIIASVFAIKLLVCSASSVWDSYCEKGARLPDYNYNHQFRDYYIGKESTFEEEIQRVDMEMAISAILFFISLIEAVVSIVSSCYACHGIWFSKSLQANVTIQAQVQYIPGPNGQPQMVIILMLNQANVMTANPTYQLTTPVGGYQTKPRAAPQGEIPTGIPQHHQAQAAVPPQPPSYLGQTPPPPEYEEKDMQLQGKAIA